MPGSLRDEDSGRGDGHAGEGLRGGSGFSVSAAASAVRRLLCRRSTRENLRWSPAAAMWRRTAFPAAGLSLTAGSGDIRLDQLDAALTVHTGSGNLQTYGCRGRPGV